MSLRTFQHETGKYKGRGWKREWITEIEVFEVELMPDLHGKRFINRLCIKSLSSGHKYVLSQDKDLTWACSCHGWTRHCDESKPRHLQRTCKHLKATGLEGLAPGTNPPQKLIEVIGEMRWYAQMARRTGTVTLAS